MSIDYYYVNTKTGERVFLMNSNRWSDTFVGKDGDETLQDVKNFLLNKLKEHTDLRGIFDSKPYHG